jgi:cytochrome P450 family 628
MKYTNQLLERIESSKGQSMNIAEWFYFYTFDVMGDLSFGKSFNMLQDGIKHYFMKVLHEDMTSIGYLSHLMWLFPIFKVTPVLNASNIKFWKWLTLQVEERKKVC